MGQVSQTVHSTTLCLWVVGPQHPSQRVEHGVLNPRVLDIRGWVTICAEIVIRNAVPQHIGAATDTVGFCLEDLCVECRNGEDALAPLRPRDIRTPQLIPEG